MFLVICKHLGYANVQYTTSQIFGCKNDSVKFRTETGWKEVPKRDIIEVKVKSQ